MRSPAPSSRVVATPRTGSDRNGSGDRSRRHRPSLAGVGIPLTIGLVHVALIAPRYQVGSFDDDAGYILSAKALLAGHGLAASLPMGERVVGLYPPGYSALIAPLLWLWPHSYLPLRLLSAACYAAAFPLLWTYLGRRGWGSRTKAAALLVLALGPPFATFAGMAMAETPFVVVLLLMLLAVDHWRESDRVLSAPSGATVICAAALVWLKQAGIGVVAGLAIWLLLAGGRRRLARAGVLCLGVAASLVPVVVDRLGSGIPLAGSRYSFELGVYYQGGLLSRLTHVLPSAGWHLLSTAVPATIVPYLEPLPIGGHWPDLWKVLSWQVTILSAVGAVVWARRFRDAAVPIAVVYLLESALWPYVNERRVILVLPVVVAWYVIGAGTAWNFVSTRWPGRLPVSLAAGVAAGCLVVAPLVAQMPRDYLFGWGQSSSRAAGSRYAALLSGLPPGVVETDYRATVSLLSGHETAWGAFTTTSQGNFCTDAVARYQLAADRASYLLLGDLNKPDTIDSPCLQGLVAAGSWAVPLLHTVRDDASVYELVGPGTGHPDLTDLIGSQQPQLATAGNLTTLTWRLPPGSVVQQLSVGGAGLQGSAANSVAVQMSGPGGWRSVASAAGPVGADPAAAPYLLAETPGGPADAVRLVVTGPVAAGSGRPTTAWFEDFRVLGRH